MRSREDVQNQPARAAVMVTTVFGDSVIDVRYLVAPVTPRAGLVRWALPGAGGALLLAGLSAVLVGQVGLAAFLLPAGIGLSVWSWSRSREGERSPHFCVGEGGDVDLALGNAPLPAARFPLVRWSGAGHELLFAGGMPGELVVDGGYYSLATLAASGQLSAVPEIPGALALPLREGMRARVELGENTVIVEGITAPRSIERSGLAAVDWPTQIGNGLSFAAHAVALFLVFSVPPSGSSLSIDTFNSDNKLVSYLIRARTEEDAVPRWLARQREPGPAGKQVKAQGPAGQAGKRDSTRHNQRFAVKRGEGDVHAAKRLALESASSAGVLGLIGRRGGGALASLFGKEDAIGRDTLNALGGLQGDTYGESYGIGGLAVGGPGWGGGDGHGLIPTGGLDTIGDGPGRRGGRGMDPVASRLIKRKPGVVPPPVTTIKIKGGLDKDIIRRAIRRHLNEFRFCYARELQAKPELGGRILVRFTIAATGKVVSSIVEMSTMGNSNVESCVAQTVNRLSFPQPDGGGIVVVTYPFLFHAPGAGG